MNKNFCLAPWFTLFLGYSYVRPCCLFSDREIQWKTLEDIKNYWYGKKMNEVRNKFLNGILPEECKICFQRIKPRSEFYQSKIGNYVDKERITSTPPLKPLQIDLKLGNRCNLKCRMCGSWGSSNWLKTDLKLNGIDKRFKRCEDKEFDFDISRLKNSRELFTDIVRFDFKGGEPMLYDSMVEMIKWLVEWDVTKNTQLSYVTNGSIVNKDAMELWKNFKEVRLVLSLDGIDDLFYYIRGYDFKIYKETIEIYNQIENVKGLHNTAISIYNIFDVNKINNWMMERELKRFPCKYSGSDPSYECNVLNPKYLDVRILPKKYKELALKQFENGYYKNMNDFIIWLKSIQDIPEDKEQLELFVSFTKFMDKEKGTNFLDIKPEFKELFEEYSK